MGDWTSVPIVPSDEPLVVVTGERIVSRSAYRKARRRAALDDVWLRLTAAERLKEAAILLPDDLTLVLWDGWRPLELQAELFEEYEARIAQAEHLSGVALEAETKRFVSEPSRAPEHPSPHLTGGSIDLTLGDTGGTPLEMGGEFDELGLRSATGHYERSGLNGQKRAYRDRRRLLCSLMAEVGFSNYPEEWWHFDFGNEFHHDRVGGPARYGRVLELPGSTASREGQSIRDWIRGIA